jgi:hypothetical protein
MPSFRHAFAAALALVALATVGGCHRHRAPENPPPAPPPVAVAPPPRPCDVIGAWHIDNPMPGGPQEVDIAPSTDGQPGAYMVRTRSGTNLGVATISGGNQMRVDTQYTNPIYKCEVQADCDTMVCAFTGGTAPATFHRIR